MRELSLGTIIRAALLAGLAAGLVAAVFHFVATEPLIEQAISLEEQRHEMSGQTEEEPVVSRQGQRVGLFGGMLIYGVVWSLLSTVVYHGCQRWLPSGARGRLLLALAGFWSVSLIPFLKYPANPPGVGDPETIGYRQSLYVGFLALSVAGTLLALLYGRHFRQRSPTGLSRLLLAPALLVIFDLAILVVVPGNPDPIEMPLALVSTFRWLSLTGLALFWLVFGLLFAVLPRSPERGRSVLRAQAAGG